MTSSNSRASANAATVATGRDGRTDEQVAAAERAAAEDTVARLTTKRDKAAQHLADAEQALADAEAQLKGDD